jgi:hypothetical protein
MALRLCDVQRDTIANRALKELMHHYTVAEENSRLVLTKKSGDIKLFLYELDDLHQLDFVQNRQMVREIERLRVRSSTIDQQRESWKVRALMAEAQLLEATARTSNNRGCQKVTDFRYASLKRYLAKRFHPDHSPGQGIEKIVRSEIFKEIWNEIERLDQGVSATRFATARSSSAA